MENPYSTPASDLTAPVEVSETIESVKGGQKLIIYSILVNFLVAALTQVNPMLGLLSFVALAMSLYGLYKLGKGMQAATWLKVLVVLLMLVPLINLVTLLVINSKATKMLRVAGYKVGIVGAYK